MFKNKMITYETLQISISVFFNNLFEELEKDSKSDDVEYLIICLCKIYTTIQESIKKENRVIFLEKFDTIKNKDIILFYRSSFPLN